MTRLVLAALLVTSLAHADEPRRPHFLPWRDPSATARRATTPPPDLQYMGGPVIANVKVHVLLWGPDVHSTVVSVLPGFFAAVTQSPWQDLMAQYATPVQQIGHGGFGTMVMDPVGPPVVVSDSDIQDELGSALDSGLLPPADLDTLYYVMFPPGTSITSFSAASCVKDGFCAYHSDFHHGDSYIYYAVMPDFQGGCSEGCGAGGEIATMESTMSHELAEAITDPIPNSGWYDPNQPDTTGGEIGDICVAAGRDQSEVDGVDTVQLLWSNADMACVARTPPADDWAIAPDPAAIKLAPGQTMTVGLTTSVARGNAVPLTLSVLGASPGLTATIAPPTLDSGGSAVLTLTAAADAVQVITALSVVAASGDFTHDTRVTVTVGTPPDFSFTVTPATQVLLTGGSVDYTIDTTVVTPPVPDIMPVVLVPPLGVVVTFDPPIISAGGSAKMTLTASGSLILTGGNKVNVVAIAGPINHTETANVQIVQVDAGFADAPPPPPDAMPPDATPASGGGGGCQVTTATGTGGAGLVVILLGVLLLPRRQKQA